MKINFPSDGQYIIAVSGGVDSVVLLDALSGHAGLDLIVAHFDHGIRPDSYKDAAFVERLAKDYGLAYEWERRELGPDASEATARKVRYDFLHRMNDHYGADGIITAHHQDDLIETAVLNVLRGTKRRGLVSLQSGNGIERPLLNVSKDQILNYAKKNHLEWREDSTNTDTKYKRNSIRQKLKKSLTPELRTLILNELKNIDVSTQQLNEVLDEILATQAKNQIDKKLLNAMQLAEAYEVVAEWLRINEVEFDSETLKRLVIGARTLQNSAQIDLKKNVYAVVKRDKIVLERR